MMFYESKLEIDVGTNPDRPRPGRLWLRNLYHVHQRLCMAFPSAQRKARDPHFLEPYNPHEHPEDFPIIHTPRSNCANFLYQILPRPHGRVLIIVRSAMKPDWDYAFHNAQYLLRRPPECQSGDYLITEDDEYQFELVANPTKKVGTLLKSERLNPYPAPASKSKNGRRIPVPSEQWPAWLEHKAKSHGFKLVGDLRSTPSYARVVKPKESPIDNTLSRDDVIAYHKGRILAVRFQGRLKVVNAADFKNALVAGIGPAKAFGCGLLYCYELKLTSGDSAHDKARSSMSA
ncbi:MAG: type I-E CRISPR-associated protein Cas6/Cse3/CasE [Candidatus Sumerlaeaceae bacterium]|jgi:CRISPR system Cascade subunit CasE